MQFPSILLHLNITKYSFRIYIFWISWSLKLYFTKYTQLCFKLLMHAELSVPLGALINFLVYHFLFYIFNRLFWKKILYKNSFHLHFHTCIIIKSYEMFATSFCAMCEYVSNTTVNGECFKTIENENQAESTFQWESITNRKKKKQHQKRNHRQKSVVSIYQEQDICRHTCVYFYKSTRAYHMWIL